MRDNDAFQVACYSDSGEGVFYGGGPPEDCPDISSSKLLAITSTVNPFDAQPSGVRIIDSMPGEIVIQAEQASSRFRVLGIASTGFAVAVLILVLFSWQFTIVFFRTNWPIIPASLLFASLLVWLGRHLFLRAKYPPQLRISTKKLGAEWLLISTPDWLSRPVVRRQPFVPHCYFIARTGHAKELKTTVSEAAMDTDKLCFSGKYVLGCLDCSGLWLSLLVSSSEDDCMNRLRDVMSCGQELVLSMPLNEVDFPWLVWATDDDLGGGVVANRSRWA